MLRHWKITLVAAWIACLHLPSLWADQVTLKNGDRVTGSIVKKDAKLLTIKSEHFGTISVAWEQVESVKADAPLTVVLQNGKEVEATLTPANGKVEVISKDARVEVAPAEIAAIRDTAEQRAYQRLLRPRLTELWAGAATIGFAGTSGNAHTSTFTTGFTAARLTRTDKTSLYFNSIKATALTNGTSAGTAEAVRGGVAYDHNIKTRLFWNAFNDYEYDRFQSLDLRFVLGGGLGYHAIQKERSRLDLVGGADFNRSQFSTPLTRKSAEFYWGDDYALKLRGATSLVQTFRMFDDLTNTGQFRMNFDIGATTRIAKWLTWNVSISDRYLNTPAPGRKTNDLLYTTGLGITFVR